MLLFQLCNLISVKYCGMHRNMLRYVPHYFAVKYRYNAVYFLLLK